MARIKGIVMENQNGKALIMTHQGEFKRIRINQPIDVGEFYIDTSLVLWKYAVAAVVVITISLGIIDFFSVKAYAQVSPSVEIGINRWHIVVAAHALDSSGEAILEQSRLIGQKVDVAVERIVDQSLQNGSLKEETLPEQIQVQAVGPGQDEEAFVQRVEENVKEGVKKSIDKNQANSDKKVQGQNQGVKSGQESAPGQNLDRSKKEINKDKDKDKDKDKK